jgi:hypothetical protein
MTQALAVSSALEDAGVQVVEVIKNFKRFILAS